ncbi:MAG: methyltransferase domain-containing protein [Caldilineales bacterium]|nr:methyltransferase domain-containing protein [Caldilineales bacterium]
MRRRARYGHFDWIAPFYDRVFGSADHEALFRHLQAGAGDIVLDIGGGTGRVAQHLAQSGAKVYVVDPSPGMLAGTQFKNLRAIRSLAETLPFPSASIDRIYVVDAFHHFADQRIAASELVRVLCAGGRIVIEEPDLRRWPVKCVAVAEKLALMQSHFLSPPELAKLFGGLGASLVEMSPDGISAHIVLEKRTL